MLTSLDRLASWDSRRFRPDTLSRGQRGALRRDYVEQFVPGVHERLRSFDLEAPILRFDLRNREMTPNIERIVRGDKAV